MFNLEELSQLVAFAQYGTLSKAAEMLNISQPSLTRSMKNLEDKFGVPLFERSKNKITLNDTGKLAVEQAQKILTSADDALRIVRAYDKSLRTIKIQSCAPAPLWSMIPSIANNFAGMSVSSELLSIDEIIENVMNGSADLGVVIDAPDEKDVICKEYQRENLSICLSQNHPLARKKSVTFADLNGYNCLLKSQIGFWYDLCKRKMPASKFLIQTNDFEFAELARSSTLPFFVTNISKVDEVVKGRIILPIEDSEADVTYYVIGKNKKYIEIL